MFFFFFFKHILINENEGCTGEVTCDTLICLIICPFINTLSCDHACFLSEVDSFNLGKPSFLYNLKGMNVLF